MIKHKVIFHDNIFLFYQSIAMHCRLVMSTTSWHRQRGSSSDLLDKLWTRVWVEPLSADELVKVCLSFTPLHFMIIDC